jgi:hypothetical protein
MVCRPLIERNSVDLPEPDGPISAIISPLRTSRDTESSARRAPKLLETFRMDRTAASGMDGEGSPKKRAQGGEYLSLAKASWHARPRSV